MYVELDWMCKFRLDSQMQFDVILLVPRLDYRQLSSLMSFKFNTALN